MLNFVILHVGEGKVGKLLLNVCKIVTGEFVVAQSCGRLVRF